MTENNDLTNEILTKLSIIFGSIHILDPLTFEIRFQGTQDQLRRSVKELELHEIDYSVDWKHTLGQARSKPYVIAIKIVLKHRLLNT